MKRFARLNEQDRPLREDEYEFGPESSPLEPWRLAPARSIASTALVRDESDCVGQFFLSLSLAFNDLKGLVMFERSLTAYSRPAPDAWGAYFGQWQGLHLQIIRWIAGVLHETMNAIGGREGQAAIATAEFRALVSGLANNHADAWNELASVAALPATRARGATAGPRALLYGIRNYAGFHYLAEHLAPAYSKLFGEIAKKNPTVGNQDPAVSVGDSMESCRFYYADAVAQQVLNNECEANSANVDAILKLAGTMNDALGALIIAFLRSRQDG